MGKLEFEWKDVSDVPGIDSVARPDPELHQALINLGFQSVGYRQMRMPGSSEDEAVKTANKLFVDPNPTVVTAFTEREEINEVLVSPDGRASATVVKSMGGPIVIFRTISENGWVVTTSSDYPHPPRFRRNLAALLVNITDRKGVGTWRKSGYFEQIEAMGVSDLWELHKTRVQSILDSNGHIIPSHIRMAISAAGSYVAHRILVLDLESSTLINRLMQISLIGIGGLIPIVSILCLWAAASAFPENDLSGLSVPVLVLALALWLGLLVTPFFFRWVYNKHIGPNLFGPKPMTLDEIFGKINQQEGPTAENLDE